MFDHLKSSLFLCEFYSLDVDLVVDQLIDEGDNFISLDSDQDKRGTRGTISRWVGSSSRARIYEILSVILHNLILMSVPAN